MSELFRNAISFIQPTLILTTILLFFTGVFSAIIIIKKDFRILQIYPDWVWRKMKSFLAAQPKLITLFMMIWAFNAFSLFVDVISGFGAVLPFIFTIFTGLNVGIIAYKEGGLKALISMFFSPHAFFELPAAWLSMALGLRLGISIFQGGDQSGTIFIMSLTIFMKIVLPVLGLAALVESLLIVFLMKKLEHPAPFSDVPLDTQEDNDSNQ